MVYDTNDILSTNTHIAFTKNAVDKIRRKKMEKRTWFKIQFILRITVLWLFK